jgi:hypothetical protein
MTDNGPILVTGAAGQLGAVGRTVCGLLLERGLPVRAMVRREDDRAAALRAAGAEVVVGDLLEPADVYRIVTGCRRVYFGMSVSAAYLEATVTMAAVAREIGVDALVNMSQMTVSEMSIQNTTSSGQQRQHWLSEQALAWSGLPVVTIRPTMFLESFFQLAAPTVRAEAASRCRSDGARPLRLRRLMSPGWSLPFSPTPRRIWAGYTSSPVRGHKTCTGSPGSSRTRSTVRSRIPTSPPRIGNAGSRSGGCRST